MIIIDINSGFKKTSKRCTWRRDFPYVWKQYTGSRRSRRMLHATPPRERKRFGPVAVIIEGRSRRPFCSRGRLPRFSKAFFFFLIYLKPAGLLDCNPRCIRFLTGGRILISESSVVYAARPPIVFSIFSSSFCAGPG